MIRGVTDIAQLSMTTLDTIDEAVELTNMSDYTFSSSLWTTGRCIWVLRSDCHPIFKQNGILQLDG